jgi:hypothetical protein
VVLGYTSEMTTTRWSVKWEMLHRKSAMAKYRGNLSEKSHLFSFLRWKRIEVITMRHAIKDMLMRDMAV